MGWSIGAGQVNEWAAGASMPDPVAAPSGGAQVIKIIMSKDDSLTRPVASVICLMGSYTRRDMMKRSALSLLNWI